MIGDQEESQKYRERRGLGGKTQCLLHKREDWDQIPSIPLKHGHGGEHL